MGRGLEGSRNGRAFVRRALRELLPASGRPDLRMCGNLAEAQDCVQEAFIRAWDKRRSLDVDRFPEAWVRTVAYRLAISRWRKARKAFRAPDRAYAAQPPREPDVSRVALAARCSNCLPTSAGPSFCTTCVTFRWPRSRSRPTPPSAP